MGFKYTSINFFVACVLFTVFTSAFSGEHLRNSVIKNETLSTFKKKYNKHNKDFRDVGRALRMAAYKGNVPIIKFIYKKHPEIINECGDSGKTALFFAINSEKQQASTFLIKHGGNFGQLNFSFIRKQLKKINRGLVRTLCELMLVHKTIEEKNIITILNDHDFATAEVHDDKGMMRAYAPNNSASLVPVGFSEQEHFSIKSVGDKKEDFLYKKDRYENVLIDVKPHK